MHDQRSLHFLEAFLEDHFSKRETLLKSSAPGLLSAMKYSLFSSGKRFRPLLGYQVAEMLLCSAERVTPFCAAVEMIHTYSLIHDDLPALDNDDYRRGQPTNHRVFGEDMALLAGDALLTEAFCVISEGYSQQPEIGLILIKLLSSAAGMIGMVGGQVMDMQLINAKNLKTTSECHQSKIDWSKEQYLKMHELKTGALIQVVVEGVAEIARATFEQKTDLKQFGHQLGFAFQLADDLLDYDPKDLEASGFPKIFGVAETEKMLKNASESATQALKKFGEAASALHQIVEFNLSRKK